MKNYKFFKDEMIIDITYKAIKNILDYFFNPTEVLDVLIPICDENEARLPVCSRSRAKKKCA